MELGLTGETKSNEEIAKDTAESSTDILPKVEGELLKDHIKNAWEINRRHKIDIQERLVKCLYARKGEYTPTQSAQIQSRGGSEPIYYKLTGTKCRAASAWIRDTLMPAGNENTFSIEPTTLPDLPLGLDNQVREQAKARATAMIQQGVMAADVQAVVDFIEQMRCEAVKQTKNKARKRAQKMEEKISDLMDEGAWQEAFEEFIEDFVVYPTAFIKGPYVKRVKNLKWGKGWQPEVTEQLTISWRRVSPFDIYPSPFSKTVQEGNLIERLRLDRTTLHAYIGNPGYDEDEIRMALNEYDIGGLREWIWEDFERERLESSTSFIHDDKDLIDALHFWGPVPGHMLKDWGYEGKVNGKPIDDDKPYEVDAVLVGNYVIRCVVNDDPLGMRPYHSASWDSVPGTLWGVALPEQMEDVQKMINGCFRALADNMALSAGPQIYVFTDMLAEGEAVSTMHPFKIWQFVTTMTGGAQRDPIGFFQPDSHATELLGIMSNMEQRADDVTNVPRYSYGNEKISGAGATATGLGMLMQGAAKGIRRAISNIDANIIRPTVYQTFCYVMVHDDDTTIKGDCKVVPRGAAALLVREQTLTKLQTLLGQLTNPIDNQIVGLNGRATLLREIFRLLGVDMDDVIPSEEELQKMQEAMQMQAQAAAGQEAGGGEAGMPSIDPQASPQAALAGNQSQGEMNRQEGPLKSAAGGY